MTTLKPDVTTAKAEEECAMKTWALVAVISLALCGSLAAGEAARPGLAMPVLPDGLGVNIHFTDPKPGEMKMLAEGGFRWVRMDFVWGATEREKGKYDFSAYDRLLKALDEYNIKALFILDYTNRHYDGGLSPYTDEGRKAFARWAAAGVARFRGRGILWEMYNEPNIQFWKPKPNPPDYIKLALEVGKAIRQVAPEETYIGPATSQIDLKFLEECFKAGLLEYWDAVSVHPYRQKPPETVTPEYAQLRQLIARYAPPGKQIPVLSGEWGYSAVWRNFNAQLQGKYLPRQFLINLMNQVPLSIWYDWHDDGTNPTDPEHHFGTVAFAYHAGRDPVYDPKPAYKAAQTLAKTLEGFRYNKRLVQKDEADYVLLFSRQDDAGQLQVRLVVWTTASGPCEIVLPASPGRFKVIGHTGEPLPELVCQDGTLRIRLTDAPQYIIPEGRNELLLRAAQ
jgi:hypothetical protein